MGPPLQYQAGADPAAPAFCLHPETLWWAQPRVSIIYYWFGFFSFQALKIAAWEEGDLAVMDGFAVFAKQMFSFYGHRTPGLALPGWKSELPQTCSQMVAQLAVSEKKLRRLEVQSRGSRGGEARLGPPRYVMSTCCCHPSQGDFPLTWMRAGTGAGVG